MKLKIVSWNIAGGRKDKLDRRLGYEDLEDLNYFANELKKQNADIICIQENHSNDQRDIARDIAGMLQMKNVFSSPASPSHIDQDYKLGNAIISNMEFETEECLFYPNPDFDLFFSDGRKAIDHPKNLQLVKIRGLTIGNTQMLPLHVFETDYTEHPQFAKKIEETLQNIAEPIILSGDFNFNNPKDIYPNVFSENSLRESLPHKPSRPNGNYHDHIFCSESIKLIESDIIESLSDHYICVSTFEVL